MSDPEEKCRICGKPAVWDYVPDDSGRLYCDECVPHGCSCQMNKDGTPRLDEKGRELPCCEFELIHAPERGELTDAEKELANIKWEFELVERSMLLRVEIIDEDQNVIHRAPQAE